MRAARPMVQQMVSRPAQRWIEGRLDSEAYFAVGRQRATTIARFEVGTRLQRDRHWARATHWYRTVGRAGR